MGQRGKNMLSIRAVRAVVAATCGAMLVLAIGRGVGWWEASENARIAEMLLAANPHLQENEARIDAAVSEAWSAPALPRTGAVPGDIVGSTAEVSDPLWAAFPRTSFSLASTVEAIDVAAGTLFRNTQLNPADRRIGGADREVFEKWLVRKAGAVRALRSAIHDVSVQELDYLIDHGVARSVSYVRLLEDGGSNAKEELGRVRQSMRMHMTDAGATPEEVERSLADLKVFNPNVVCAGAFNHATRAGDDRIYLGDLSRMPQSRQATHAYVAAVLEVYAGIVQFFRDQGCLDEARQRDILSSIEPKLARYQAR